MIMCYVDDALDTFYRHRTYDYKIELSGSLTGINPRPTRHQVCTLPLGYASPAYRR